MHSTSEVIKGSSKYGAVVYTINGDKIIEGSSKYGKVAFTINNDKIIEGNSRYGRTVYVINGDKIIEGSSKYGSRKYTIEYERQRNSTSFFSTLGTSSNINGDRNSIQIEKERLEEEKKSLQYEREELEKERKRLEYERWYSSLSPDEKKKEDLRIEEEKKRLEREAEEFRIQYEKALKEREAQLLIDKEKQKKKNKKTIITVLCIIGVIILIVVGVTVGINVSRSIAFNNSSTGIFTKYLSEQQGYNDGKYDSYSYVEGRGRIQNSIEYKKNGFIDNYGRTCDFKVTTFLLPKADHMYSEIDGFLFFNLDGSDNEISFGTITDEYGFVKEGSPNFCANAKYGTGSVLIQYQSVTFDSEKGEPVSEFSFNNYTNWDSKYNDNLDEWVENGWVSCLSSYNFANELFKEATGTTLYK